MDATWRVFTVAIIVLMVAAAAMLLSTYPDTGGKPGGHIVGHGAADPRATIDMH